MYRLFADEVRASLEAIRNGAGRGAALTSAGTGIGTKPLAFAWHADPRRHCRRRASTSSRGSAAAPTAGSRRSPGRPSSSRRTPGSASGCASSASTSSSTRRATCSAAGRSGSGDARRSSARTSTRCPRAGGSTARSASSRPCTRSRCCRSEGFEPARPLWIVAFMDEEGTRFDAALFGSRAFAGEDVTGLGDRVDAAGTTLRDAMRGARPRPRPHRRGRPDRRGRRLPRAAHRAGPGARGRGDPDRRRHLDRRPARLPRPAARPGEPRRHDADGAAPRRVRRRGADRARAARVRARARERDRERRQGRGRARRRQRRPRARGLHDRRPRRDARRASPSWSASSRRPSTRIAREEGLEAELEPTFSLEPLELDPRLVDAVERAAAEEGATSRRLPSGAGHDAMVIGRHVPAAMIFVPSRGGISHSPDGVQLTLPSSSSACASSRQPCASPCDELRSHRLAHGGLKRARERPLRVGSD